MLACLRCAQIATLAHVFCASLSVFFLFGYSGHWNATVKQLTNSVIKMYQKGDVKLYDSILAQHNQAVKEKDMMRVKADKAWSAIISTNTEAARIK